MIVETFNGSNANKKECRFIKGNFYIKNKQCFLIDGVWYRVNSGFIVYDNERSSWVVAKNNPSLIKGIIGYDDMTKDVILGWYTPNPYKNVRVALPNGNQLDCINANILPSTVFKEDVKNMCFVPNATKISHGIPPVNFNSNGYPFPLQYCVKHYDKAMMDMFNSGVDKRRSRTQTNIGDWATRIEPFSFGFEFETNRGKIPNYRIMDSGLVPLRDGSIAGIEYATVPLSGKSGIVALEEMCGLLQRYTTFSEQESLHLHIGNIPVGKKFIGYLYTMCCILEKDIFSIFPKFYAKTSQFKARGKDYNMPLKKELVALTPEETFDNVAFYLSAGKKYQGFGAEHPSDPEGHAKWSINERYHYVNFIPLLFGSNKTIEFRCHVPTHDPIKVINWLYICSAIIKYTEKLCNANVDLMARKHTSLKEVIADTYPTKLAMYLNDYVSLRKENRKMDEMAGDGTGATEINAELRETRLYRDIS